MKTIVTQYKKTIFSMVVVAAMTVSAVAVAEAGKCSPCQAAKSIRDAHAQSIKDAQTADLAVGKPFSREAELDADAKCKPCSRTTRDEMAADIDQDPAKCKPCSRTTRDEMAASIQQDPSKDIVEACCEFCAQPGSLGCQGENRSRCNTCQRGLMRMAMAAAAIVTKEAALDELPAGVSRAPREELVDPCGPCGIVTECISKCKLNQQLCALQQCCNAVNQRLECQGKDARKCCKKIKHKIEDVKDLIGDPDAIVIDIPSCSEGLTITDFIDNTEVDMMTWLKSLYVLLYQVYLCSCNPCIE
ncbi:MAG TPA: hypothetical protein VJJ26_05675 [Candidatus Babeliales bacterium]|nr:hypothetical protein [Candidatus Babeliales bacterium]